MYCLHEGSVDAMCKDTLIRLEATLTACKGLGQHQPEAVAVPESLVVKMRYRLREEPA